jgi:hypothetical protein
MAIFKTLILENPNEVYQLVSEIHCLTSMGIVNITLLFLSDTEIRFCVVDVLLGLVVVDAIDINRSPLEVSNCSMEYVQSTLPMVSYMFFG